MISQREANFELYIQSLGAIVSWMFALDHYHYARWLSIHIKDLQQLETSCPSVYRQFMVGHFVTQKSTRKFSTMAHDQIHL